MRNPHALARLADHGVTSVPAGWTVSRVKYLANYKNGYPFKPDEWGATGAPIIRIQNLTDKSAEPNRYLGNLDEAFRVRQGDLLISWSASLGLHTWHGEDGWLNQHIFKVDLKQDLCAPQYFRWLATWFMGELQRDAHGSTMQHLTKDAFGSFPVVLPPRHQQVEIASKLSEKVANIDKLIEAKIALLSRLGEKRRALIASAVTQGLNPAAPMRDSGIAWLGSVPTHWRNERARWLFGESRLDIRTQDQMVTCFRDGTVTLRSNRREDGFTNGEIEHGYQGIRQGQLVLHSMDAFAGAIGVSESDGKCTPEYVICDPLTSETDAHYFALLLREMALRRYIQAHCSAVRERAPRIRFNEFKDFVLPLPPHDEQRAIVAYIERQTLPLLRLAEQTRTTLDLLKERRTALIAQAIAGAPENAN